MQNEYANSRVSSIFCNITSKSKRILTFEDIPNGHFYRRYSKRYVLLKDSKVETASNFILQGDMTDGKVKLPKVRWMNHL